MKRGLSRVHLIQWLGIGLVGGGALWQSALPPSVIGWGFILSGFAVTLVWGRHWPVRTPLDGPLLVMAAMGCGSLLVTALLETTRIQVVRLCASLAVFYAMVNWAWDRGRLLFVGRGLILGGVGLAVIAPFTVDWLRPTKFFLIPSRFYDSLPLLVSDPVHPNVMAALLVLILPIPLACLLLRGGTGLSWRRLGGRIACGASSLTMGVVLLLTRSRGGYVAGAVGGLIVLWMFGRKRWALIAAGGALGLGAWVLAAGASPDQSLELVQGAADPSTWAFRQQVWSAAVSMLADFPFTGVGMGLFNDVASLLYGFFETANPGAHNLYLQVGVDLGLPGLIAYLSVLILTLTMAVVTARTLGCRGFIGLRAMEIGALAGLVAMMVHGLFDVTVWGTRAAFFPWLVIGFLAALHRWMVVSDAQSEMTRASHSRA